MLAGLLPPGRLWNLEPPGPTSILGVTRDATNLNYYPANAAEATLFMAAAGLAGLLPSSIWPMQEASGSFVDTISGVNLTSTFTLYQQTMPGATRKCARGVDGTVGSKAINSTTAPNPSLESTLMIAHLDIPVAPAAVRDVMMVASNADLRYNATGKLRLVTSASADLVSVPGASQRWVALQINISDGTSKVFTGQEKFTGAYVLPTSGTIVALGGQTAAIAGIGYSYAMRLRSSAAELTDAEVKILLQTFGETVLW